MITLLNHYANYYDVVINFIAHFIIFIGTLYVAVHNRRLPQWHVAPLWYVGLFSVLVCITAVIQWVAGVDHPMSYQNLGKLAETLVDVAVASVALIMFIGTVMRDLHARKLRQKID